MSATSPQARPNVKQAVASFNRRHFASPDDQFRVGSYVVHTPPTPARYTCAGAVSATSKDGGALAFSQRQPTITNNNNKLQFPTSSSPISCLPSSRIASALIKSSSPVASANNHRNKHPSPATLSSQQDACNTRATMGDYLSTPLVGSRIPQDNPPSSPRYQLSTSDNEQHNLSSQSDLNSTPKFHYKRRIPATIATTNSNNQSPLNNRCEITPRLPRGISRIPHQIYHGKKTGNESAADCDDVVSDRRDESRFLTFSKDQANSHAKSLKDNAIRDAKASSKNAEEEEENEELLVIEMLNCSRSSSQKVPNVQAINSHHPIPVERQFIKSKENLVSRAIVPALSSATIPTSRSSLPGEIEAPNSQPLVKTASSSSCRSQPICEAFIMTGQSMLKLSCTETNNNIHTVPNGNSKLLQKQEKRLDENSASVKLDDQPGTISSNTVEVTDDKIKATGITDNVINLDLSDCAQEPAITAKVSIIDPRNDITTAIASDATTSNPSTSKQSPDSTMVEQHLVDEEDKGKNIPKEEEEKNNSIEHTTTKCHPIIASNTCDQMDDKSSLIDENSSSSHLSSSTTGGFVYDLDSARRLAKRLYSLSGFKKSDVSHHLGKSNQFSEMVAEEYLNLFEFKSMKLDTALRKFLSKFQLNGETQERERILSRFSQRYYNCNSDKFPSSDIVQTLVCALILLNTDLHARHGGKKKSKRSTLSLGAFIDGLNSSVVALAAAEAQENKEATIQGNHLVSCDAGNTFAPYSFPRHILVDLYESIKKKPLKSNEENCDMSMFESELDKIYSQHLNNQVASSRSSTLPTRRLLPTSSSLSAATMNSQTKHRYKLGLSKLELFDNNDQLGQTTLPANDKTIQPIQFKSGYLNKKRTFEANGKATVKGKRLWTRVHVILVDLNIIFQLGIKKSQEEFRFDNQKAVAKQMKNSVKIYHSLAIPSTTYTKRNFVFHLKLADESEYLLQASDQNEMSSWIEAINFASACLSTPVLPNSVSSRSPSKQRKVDKLKLPVSYTKLKYWDQLVNHEERLQKLRSDLDEHIAAAPNIKSAKKSCKNRFIERIAYLRHEIQRYSVYVDLMRKKSNSNEAMVLSKNPHLVASLNPSDKMIKVLPSFAPSIEGQVQ